MSLRITSSWKGTGMLLAGIVLIAAAVLFVLKGRTPVVNSPAPAPTSAETYPGLDIADP